MLHRVRWAGLAFKNAGTFYNPARVNLSEHVRVVGDVLKTNNTNENANVLLLGAIIDSCLVQGAIPYYTKSDIADEPTKNLATYPIN
jgi:hypothetical protein